LSTAYSLSAARSVTVAPRGKDEQKPDLTPRMG
jgi:hypothetical protein